MKAFVLICMSIFMTLTTFAQPPLTTATAQCWDAATKKSKITIYGANGTIAHVLSAGLPSQSFTVAVTSDPFIIQVSQNFINIPSVVTIGFYATITSTLPMTTVVVRTNSLSCSLTLPVLGLQTFSATYSGSNFNFTWTSSQEVNNSRFEIQKSLDAQAFATIKTVNTAAPGGNSSTSINYSTSVPIEFAVKIGSFGLIFGLLLIGILISNYKRTGKFVMILCLLVAGSTLGSCSKSTDNDGRFTGKVYFRLKQVDLDGNATFSDTKVVTVR